MAFQLNYCCLFCGHKFSHYKWSALGTAQFPGTCTCPNCDNDAEPSTEE